MRGTRPRGRYRVRFGRLRKSLCSHLNYLIQIYLEDKPTLPSPCDAAIHLMIAKTCPSLTRHMPQRRSVSVRLHVSLLLSLLFLRNNILKGGQGQQTLKERQVGKEWRKAHPSNRSSYLDLLGKCWAGWRSSYSNDYERCKRGCGERRTEWWRDASTPS